MNEESLIIYQKQGHYNSISSSQEVHLHSTRGTIDRHNKQQLEKYFSTQ